GSGVVRCALGTSADPVRGSPGRLRGPGAVGSPRVSRLIHGIGTFVPYPSTVSGEQLRPGPFRSFPSPHSLIPKRRLGLGQFEASPVERAEPGCEGRVIGFDQSRPTEHLAGVYGIDARAASASRRSRWQIHNSRLTALAVSQSKPATAAV